MTPPAGGEPPNGAAPLPGEGGAPPVTAPAPATPAPSAPSPAPARPPDPAPSPAAASGPAPSPATGAGHPTPASGDAGPPPEGAEAVWQAAMARLEGERFMIWTRSFQPLSLEAGVMTIRPAKPSRDLAGFVDERRAGQLGKLLTEVAGRSIRVKVEKPAPGGQTQVLAAGAERQEAHEKALALPVVRKLVDLFGASLESVEPDARAPELEPPPAEGIIPPGDAEDAGDVEAPGTA